MALRVLSSIGNDEGGYSVVPLLGQSVTRQEIANEITGRGYIRGIAPATPTPAATPPPTTPTISREQAIAAGVDWILDQYRKPHRCATPGGCYISPSQWDIMVYRGTLRANYYLTQGTISGFYGLDFGQIVQPPVYQQTQEVTAPAMTTDEKVSLGLQLLSNAAQVASTYFQGRAERTRLQQMGQQIPAMTAAQVQEIINKALAQGLGTPNQLQSVAAGMFGQEPKAETPGWLVPAIVGIGAVVVMMVMKK